MLCRTRDYGYVQLRSRKHELMGTHRARTAAASVVDRKGGVAALLVASFLWACGSSSPSCEPATVTPSGTLSLDVVGAWGRCYSSGHDWAASCDLRPDGTFDLYLPASDLPADGLVQEHAVGSWMVDPETSLLTLTAPEPPWDFEIVREIVDVGPDSMRARELRDNSGAFGPIEQYERQVCSPGTL